MRLRHALTPLLLPLLLAACGSQEPSAPADATAPAAASEAPAEAVADEPAADAQSAEAAAAPADEAEAAADSDTTTAAPAAPAPAVAAPPGEVPGLVRGRDYEIIQGGQPFAVGNGIEVAEVFAYWCGACAQFDPLVSAWRKRLPADVRFTYVPAVFNPQDNFPRAFYAAEAMGVADAVHGALFRAIHLERGLRPNASVDDIAAFFGKHGVSAEQAKSTMGSFAVNGNLGRARQFAVRSGVNATPTLVVNGRYRVVGSSHENQLQIAERLIAHEREAAAQ
jgi:thiol:disulfide interchange protein DsbA